MIRTSIESSVPLGRNFVEIVLRSFSSPVPFLPFFRIRSYSLFALIRSTVSTVTLHFSFLPLTFAVMVHLPGLKAFTTPFLFTFAIFLLLLFHVTFFLVPITRSFTVFS